MKPIASSATAGTKPGEARVTSTPASEAAATSMLRISTAQRTHRAQFRQLREDLAPALGDAIGHDDVDIACCRDEAGGIERRRAVVQLDIGKQLAGP